jgi:hypothetical protein
MVKRTVGTLALLGLVYAVALPAANAAAMPTVLWQPDLSTGKLVGPMVGGKEAPIYTQGVNDATKGADDTSKDYPGIAPFVVVTEASSANEADNACSCDKAKGWLDGGNGNGTTTHDLASDPTEKTYASELLTGDPTWADVSIQCKMDILDQNTGACGLVLRSAPKTKPDDPDSFYVFEYRGAAGSDASADVLLDAEIRDGIQGCGMPVKDRDGSTDEIVCVRLMKVVKGKWTMLAEQDAASSKVYVPRITTMGVDHDVSTDPSSDGKDDAVLTGYYFRFTAKGNVLTGSVSKDGQNWAQVLQATDNDLTAGQVGFFGYDFHQLVKEILVQTSP